MFSSDLPLSVANHTHSQMARQLERARRSSWPDPRRARLQDYELDGVRETDRELGRGSYAAVIEVDYKGMRCAVKKIYSVLSQPGEGDRLVARFKDECRLLGKLHHPHIVQFLGIYFNHETNLPVLVMEYLPTTLTRCVERYGRLPTEVCYAILRDVALGLRYLHEHRPCVIHRDLSANNILLTGDMVAKISDMGGAKINSICTTQTPGTQSYLPPEALCSNPCYSTEVDVFSFGVMLAHLLSGQWPIPSEPTRIDPFNASRRIGLSEVERRAEYLNIIGRPSDEQEGHPLMPLIERCLSNCRNLRPIASELVERMIDAVTQQPLTFSNRVDMMQKIDSIQREKESLQTQVSMLEGQVERGEVAQREQREHTQRQEMALSVEVEQLRLQVSHLEAEKTHIVTTATAREELHHTEMQALQSQYEKNKRQLQEEVELRDDQLQEKATELSSQSSLLSEQRSTIEGLHSQLQQARQCLTSGSQVHAFSPNASLKWRECASVPMHMKVARATVINGMVYMGGGIAEGDDFYRVCKYNPVKNEWNTLPPAPVGLFGVGQLNGKLVIVGGGRERGGGTGESVNILEDGGDTLRSRWVDFNPPMPTALACVRVASHTSALVVCGMPDESSPASLFVYNSKSSKWHSRASPPLPFNSTYSSTKVMNDRFYLAIGAEGVLDSESHQSSPAVFSLPMSTLLDPNTPQDKSSWQRMPDTPCYRPHLAATGGCLLALGGYRRACNLRNAEQVAANLSTAVYAHCPATSSWVEIGDLPDLRACSTTTTLLSGELFVAGGTVPNDEDDSMDSDRKAFVGTFN